MRRTFVLTLAAGMLLLIGTACRTSASGASRQVWDRRIAPILKSPNPSSCAECHLGGVDLKDYLGDTEEKTFASLREQGLIDLKNPDGSKLLKLIGMSSPTSPLVSRKVRALELEAFREWIRASAADPKLAKAVRPAQLQRPAAPNPVIRHGRIDQVLERFEATVWAQQQRCAGCHAPGTDLNRKHVEKFGDRVNWIVKDNPRATLARAIERRLVNPEAPAKSLLLLKATMAVEHGGGKKMQVGDEGYKSFRRFIEDYAAILNGRYRAAKDLPPAPRERFLSTDYWFKLTDTPVEWGDKLLGVDLHAWDERTKSWAKARSATSDRQVFGKGALWQHNLDLVVPAGSPTPPADLARGRYRVKIYVDRTGALEKDWERDLRRPENLAAELEFAGGGWRPGYGAMKAVSVRKDER